MEIKQRRLLTITALTGHLYRPSAGTTDRLRLQSSLRKGKRPNAQSSGRRIVLSYPTR
jgi:hypothetical protein